MNKVQYLADLITVRYSFLFLFILVGLSATTAQPDRRIAVKRLYIANDDHTDCMWTANEAKYDTAFVHMLDYSLHQIDSTARRPGKNNAPDFQARFNCDGSYWLRAYQKFRSPAQFNRLIDAIRSGHIGSPLNTLVSTYGAQPTEAVLRDMYYAGQLERQYKLRFTLAEAMENNTLPLGLASLWAGSGAKYSWKGIGGYGSQMTYGYQANRRKQVYHYTGLDSSSLRPSEEGIHEDLIARFWNVASKPVTPMLTTRLPIRQAWQTTHIETNERVLEPSNKPLQVRFAPNQLNSYRIQLNN